MFQGSCSLIGMWQVWSEKHGRHSFGRRLHVLSHITSQCSTVRTGVRFNLEQEGTTMEQRTLVVWKGCLFLSVFAACGGIAVGLGTQVYISPSRCASSFWWPDGCGRPFRNDRWVARVLNAQLCRRVSAVLYISIYIYIVNLFVSPLQSTSNVMNGA